VKVFPFVSLRLSILFYSFLSDTMFWGLCIGQNAKKKKTESNNNIPTSQVEKASPI
jgi:hypothetical protein